MVLSRLKNEIVRVIWWVIIPVMGWLCVSYADSPRSDRPTEYQVKAAFLFSFAHFIEWPPPCFPDADTPITIGILGEDPFGNVLDATVREKVVDDRSFRIIRSAHVDDLKQSHILFISESERERIPSILSCIDGLPILTVGESEAFAKKGVMFSFAVRDRKVRFIINREVTEKGGLVVSSRVLKLAEIVGDKPSND